MFSLSSLAYAENLNEIGTGDTAQAQAPTPAPSPAPNLERKLKSEVEPLLHLDFDSGRQIVNLTPHRFDRGSGPETLVYRDFRRGFQVVDFVRFEGGVGASVQFHYDNVSGIMENWSADVGLIPIVGQELISVRYIPTSRALNSMTPLARPPRSMSDLRKMQIGDAVTYSTSGGITLMVGTGFSGVGIKATVIAKGQFLTYVEKVNSQFTLVEIKDNHTDSAGISLGAGFTAIGSSQFQRMDKSMSFMIKTSHPVGAKVFEDLVRGNISAAQIMSQRTANNIVRPWKRGSAVRAGALTNIYVGIPIFANATWSTGSMKSFETTQQLTDSTRMATQYSVYMKDHRSVLFGTHDSSSEVFYGGTYRLTKSGRTKQVRGVFGEWVWSYSSDAASSEHVESATWELIRKTGLRDLLFVNVPENENLQYVAIGARMAISEEQTAHMMSLARRRGPEAMIKRALDLSNRYFSRRGDLNGLCIRGSLEVCQSISASETQEGVKKMWSALLDMNRAAKSGRDTEFAAAYARFGKAMLTNQFTFQAAVALMGEGVSLDFTVKGSMISSYTLTLESGSGPDLFKPVHRAPIKENRLGQGVPTHDNGGSVLR